MGEIIFGCNVLVDPRNNVPDGKNFPRNVFPSLGNHIREIGYAVAENMDEWRWMDTPAILV